MRRITVVPVVLWGCVLAADAGGQSADELAARWLAATGGADAWAAVQTLQVRSRSEYFSSDLLVKQPNRLRHDAWSEDPGQRDIRAFDGMAGWRVNPMEGTTKPRSMSAREIEALRADRDWMMELVDYKARGYRLEPAGRDQVNGAPAARLKITRPTGDTVFVFIDDRTSLEVRRVRPSRTPDGDMMDIVIDVGDYRRVGKLLLPHRVGPATREYVIDAPIDDAQFRLAAKSEQERAREQRARVTARLLEVGAVAPEWSLKDASGRVYRASDYRGRVVVMDFWAVWCAPCHAMMPGLQKLHDELSPRGVAVLGISTFERGADPSRLVQDRGYTYPVLLNGDTIADAFHVVGLPTVYVIGRDGRIIDASAGADAESESRRRAVIDAHLRAPARASPGKRQPTRQNRAGTVIRDGHGASRPGGS